MGRFVVALVALLGGCSRTQLDAGLLPLSADDSPAAGGRVGVGGAGGATGDLSGGAGSVGGSGLPGIGSSGNGGVGGDAAGGVGVPFVDRCLMPGAAPAVGRADGSDYHFGEVLEIGTNYWSSLVVTDLDRNWRPDIVGLDWFTPAMVYLQLEPGRFSAGSRAQDVAFSGFAPSTGLASLDIDGDGAPDLVATRGNSHGLTAFPNDGSGHFPSSYALGSRSLGSPVVWDVDGDGDLDVVAVANDEMYINTNSELALYINDGTKLALERLVPFPVRGGGLQVANVRGDERPELLLGTEGPPRGVIVFEQKDFASIVQVQEIFATGDVDDTELWWQPGDLDGDGTDDLVLVEDENEPDRERVWISWSRNGVLSVAKPVATLPKDGGNIAGGVPRIADLNVDGRMDIAISSGAFNMVALLGQPDLTYRLISEPYPNSGSVIESAIAVGDINCDGCPDVLGVQVSTIRAFTGVGCARR